MANKQLCGKFDDGFAKARLMYWLLYKIVYFITTIAHSVIDVYFQDL